ncbi:MAG: hypothetical protein HY519_01085 [Candidatus Aenigmarchaeota archaeon]|nr:hypothetical protein [Candidatus Aenigmarchaeota archaeon]
MPIMQISLCWAWHKLQAALQAKVVFMAKYKCETCGFEGKPLFMEPATRLCPACKGIRMKKAKG